MKKPKVHCQLGRHNYRIWQRYPPNDRARDRRERIVYRCYDCNHMKVEYL